MLEHTRDRCFIGWLNNYLKRLKENGKIRKFAKERKTATIFKKN